MLQDDLQHQVRLDPALALQVDGVCNRFEEALRGGRQPRIEEYLGQVPAQARAFLLHELMVAELEHGVAGATEEAYRQRFPNDAGLFRKARAAAAASRAISSAASVRALADAEAAWAPRNPAAATVPLATALTPIDSVLAFIGTLRSMPLLQPVQLTDLRREHLQGTFATSHDLAKWLLQREWLTPYQVNLLLQGRGRDLELGAYLLQERLGEGGTGQVFKARHQAMNRLVAVKVIRQDLVNDPEALRRFYREIRVVGQLDHPHLIHAYDAGPVGSRHILVMEHVPGTDLGRLIKEKGPLPVVQACEYIRQAALGLQRAHERGLVHRDIKPNNLLLARDSGLVKVLDLGLARLQTTADSEATSLTTPQGSVMMGTPDYLAPEQALDFHGADARADVYGLGCTLFHLLTGQPPFAGGTLAEKLLRHQQSAPPGLTQFRPDVPAELEVVIGKMLAKDPAQRYQTAGAVAEALAPWATGRPPIVPLPMGSRAEEAVAFAAGKVADATEKLSPPVAVRLPLPPGDVAAGSGELSAAVPAPSARKLRITLAVGGGLLLSGILLGWLLGRPGPSPPTSRLPAAKDTWTGIVPTRSTAAGARPRETVFLCDLPEQDVVAWFIGKNGLTGTKNPGSDDAGERIIVKGKASPHGLFIHPWDAQTARVVYQLNKQYQQFSATVTLNDSVKNEVAASQLVFEVCGDQKRLWQSKPLNKKDMTDECSVSVSGVSLLELRVLCPGPCNRAHAVWLEPQLTK